jgi:FAD synthetase
MNSSQKFILSSIYCNSLINGPTLDSLISYIENKKDLNAEIFFSTLIDLEKLGYVILKYEPNTEESKQIVCQLSDLGRSKIKVVLVGGVFDILHLGHIYTLKTAKSFGDILVVIVATNSTALKMKKNRDIYHDEKQRQELVSSLSFVDLSLIGKEGTLYDTVSFVKPDIIALGYDQSHDEKEIQKNCFERGLRLNVVRLSSTIPKIKSTLIKRSLGNYFYDL